MAVQAQYPSNTGLFSTDYPRKAPRSGVRGLQLDDAATANQAANLLGVAAMAQPLLPQRQVAVYGTTMFSGEPESDLTCNVSGSRKRARDDNAAPAVPQLNLLQQQHQHQQQQLWLASDAAKVNQGNLLTAVGAGVSNGLHASHDNSRLNDSAMSSTSGRAPSAAPPPVVSSPAINPLVQGLVSQLYSQSHEIDTLIRLQVPDRSSQYIFCSILL